jgi:hypothetical protein
LPEASHIARELNRRGVRPRRSKSALARLPGAERQAWQKLWTDIADALARAVEMLHR